MKNFIVFFLLATPTLISAQKLKKVTEDKYQETIYYVLESDPTVKHGSYQEYYEKQLLINGFYKQGLKDSVWTEYSHYGNKQSEGAYFQDQKVGAWEFYNHKGDKEQVYDYTKKEMIYFRPLESQEKSEVLIGTDTSLVLLERPALYIGGSRAIGKVLTENVVYPQDAVEKEISGKVYISFMVDTEGRTFGHKVKSGFYTACNQEALRVIKMIPNNWFPAVADGKPVTTEVTIPVNFKLQ